MRFQQCYFIKQNYLPKQKCTGIFLETKVLRFLCRVLAQCKLTKNACANVNKSIILYVCNKAQAAQLSKDKYTACQFNK